MHIPERAGNRGAQTLRGATGHIAQVPVTAGCWRIGVDVTGLGPAAVASAQSRAFLKRRPRATGQNDSAENGCAAHRKCGLLECGSGSLVSRPLAVFAFVETGAERDASAIYAPFSS